MINLAAWNIRGLNAPHKQKEISNLIVQHKISIFAILETKVKKNRRDAVKSKIFRSWCMEDNYDHCTGGRIWVGWNPEKVNVNVVFSSSQMVICNVTGIEDKCMIWCSFIYGLNEANGRKDLWKDLEAHARLFSNDPWIVLGDFNAIQFLH